MAEEASTQTFQDTETILHTILQTKTKLGLAEIGKVGFQAS